MHCEALVCDVLGFSFGSACVLGPSLVLLGSFHLKNDAHQYLSSLKNQMYGLERVVFD